MAVLKSKDFPQIRKLVKLCGKFVVVKDRMDIDITQKRKVLDGGLLTRLRRWRVTARGRAARAHGEPAAGEA